MENKNIKIFVTYKDKHKIIETDIIKSIQTGRAIADEVFKGMIGDDTGDNISSKNDLYAELSAQYWVWKNYESAGNADYIGFMHYRRHFIFNENYKHKKTDKRSQFGYSAYVFNTISYDYMNNIELNDKTISRTLDDNYDLICVKKANAKYLNCKNGKEDFIKNCFGSHPEDYEKCMQIVLEKFPEYEKAINLLNKGPYRYFYNMFVMKKELFFKYNEFLFTILKEFENSIDTTYYSEKAKRVCGYMGEFLLTLFIFKLYENKNISIKELYTSFILDTKEEDTKILEPIFKNNYTAIAMSSSNAYVPYLSVCLESLKECCNENNNYDVIIFERDISERNKKIIIKQVAKNNISVRFVNPINVINKYNLKFPEHYNLECYFRLTSPLILNKYKKIIFTDVDILFNTDIQDLYNIELGNFPLAACKDLIFGSFIQTPHQDWMEYCQNILKLKHPFEYFNTGVMLINVDEFNSNNYTTKLLEFVSKTQYRILEQDGLNSYFQNRIKYIDTAWNFPIASDVYKTLFVYMPEKFLKQYKKDEQNPKVIHFAGGAKPWFYPELDFSEKWWSYAIKTPFYEQILKNMIGHTIAENSNGKYFAVKNYRKNCLNYWKCKLLRNITFGETKEHYVDKKYRLKQQIKLAKNFI